MPLHLQYRPDSLADFYGNDSLKASLQSILSRLDKPRAFMMTGPSGCGKTTIARIIARDLGCNPETSDYQELNVSDARGIDSARDIIRSMQYSPIHGKVKVFCLDEVQGSVATFQEALLKVLEDTPKHVAFVLCTTDPQKLKKTIHTRCSRFEVKPLDNATMQSFLLDVLKKEGIEEYPSGPIAGIIEAAEGSPRAALVILDQIIDLPDEDAVMAAINRFTVAEGSVIELCRGLLQKNWPQCKAQLLAMDKADTEKIRQGVLTYMRKCLLGDRPDHGAYLVIRHFERNFFDGGLAMLTGACWAAANRQEPKDIHF